MPQIKITTQSPEETARVGCRIGQVTQPPVFVGLIGPLGSGKTLLVKAIVAQAGFDPNRVHSPTFTLMNIYEAKFPTYHFDFYRLEKPRDFEGLGLDEFFYDPQALVLVEWAEKVWNWIPKEALKIEIQFGKSDQERLIFIESFGNRTEKMLKEFSYESTGD